VLLWSWKTIILESLASLQPWKDLKIHADCVFVVGLKMTSNFDLFKFNGKWERHMPVRFKREFPWLESLVLTISFPEKLTALLSYCCLIIGFTICFWFWICGLECKSCLVRNCENDFSITNFRIRVLIGCYIVLLCLRTSKMLGWAELISAKNE